MQLHDGSGRHRPMKLSVLFAIALAGSCSEGQRTSQSQPSGNVQRLGSAAQPKLARIDAGLSVRLHVPALHASLSADWRFRLAGRAGPASGPALTLWTDF